MKKLHQRIYCIKIMQYLKIIKVYNYVFAYKIRIFLTLNIINHFAINKYNLVISIQVNTPVDKGHHVMGFLQGSQQYFQSAVPRVQELI